MILPTALSPTAQFLQQTAESPSSTYHATADVHAAGTTLPAGSPQYEYSSCALLVLSWPSASCTSHLLLVQHPDFHLNTVSNGESQDLPPTGRSYLLINDSQSIVVSTAAISIRHHVSHCEASHTGCHGCSHHRQHSTTSRVSQLPCHIHSKRVHIQSFGSRVRWVCGLHIHRACLMMPFQQFLQNF